MHAVLSSSATEQAPSAIKSINMKHVNYKHIVDVLKHIDSLKSQNNYLSQYLAEMVKENERLTESLADVKETL